MGGGEERWGGREEYFFFRMNHGGRSIRMNHGGNGGESWRIRINRGAFAWGEFHFVTAYVRTRIVPNLSENVPNDVRIPRVVFLWQPFVCEGD